jgi:starch synthase
LAGAMERLLGDPGFAASLAASGRERALREYSWQRAADRTRQCYSRVLRRDTMA